MGFCPAQASHSLNVEKTLSRILKRLLQIEKRLEALEMENKQ